jgi:outer membrane protein assembly factor BamB
LLAGDLIVVATDGRTGTAGFVYAFDQQTGHVRWKYDAAGDVPSDVVRYRNMAYALTQEDKLLAFDLQSGDLRWSFEGRGRFRGRPKFVSSPAVADERVFFSGRDGVLYAVHAETGALVWALELGTALTTPPTIREGVVYVGAIMEGRIVGVDADTGKLVAEVTAPGPVALSPDGVAAGVIVARGDEVQLRDASLEQLVWSRRSSSGMWNRAPRVFGDLVLAGSTGGQVYGYRLSDGAVAFSVELDGVIAGIGSAGDVLYIGTQEGMLYAIRR